METSLFWKQLDNFSIMFEFEETIYHLFYNLKVKEAHFNYNSNNEKDN